MLINIYQVQDRVLLLREWNKCVFSAPTSNLIINIGTSWSQESLYLWFGIIFYTRMYIHVCSAQFANSSEKKEVDK